LTIRINGKYDADGKRIQGEYDNTRGFGNYLTLDFGGGKAILINYLKK